jgi:MFS family permease
MGLVATPWAAVLVRTADRFGKGIRSAPRDALVADLVPAADRGRAFGHIRALDHAGAAVGPLVAMLFLLAFPGAERRLFLLTLLPGLATLAVIWRFVRDPNSPAAAARPAPAGRLSRPQTALLSCVAVWALGASSEQFLLLRVSSLGLPAAFVPLVWFVMSLAKGAAAARAGRLADGVPPRLVLAAGWLLFAAAYGGLAWATHLWTTVALVVAVGVAYGVAEPAERALVAALAPDGRQGGAFGWYALVQGLMALPAGLVAGWLWDRGPDGPAAAFLLTTGLALAAACLLALTASRRPAAGVSGAE